MGVLSAPTSRRGEAHLWLLLEEALAAARGASDEEVREARRNHRYVSEALAETGVVDRDVAVAIAWELDDALVLRGMEGTGLFQAHPFPVEAAVSAGVPEAGRVANWLEAEIERHIDLVAGFNPTVQTGAGRQAMRILHGPARAFEAAGVLGPARSLLHDFSASLRAVGFDLGAPGEDEGRVRREWVRFLRDPPRMLQHSEETWEERDFDVELGSLNGRSARLTRLGWSPHRLNVDVSVAASADLLRRRAWFLRAIDDRGRLHLGQPSRPLPDTASALTFSLRPGFDPTTIRSLTVRLTAGWERVEGVIEL